MTTFKELDPSRTLYSVRVKVGPDVKHYDMYFAEGGIWLLYLGEYWEGLRPRTLLQQRADLYLYSLRKKRRRFLAERRPEDIFVRYEDIKEYSIAKKNAGALPRTTRLPSERADESVCIVTVKLKNGKVFEIIIPAKLYKFVRKMFREYVDPRLGKPS